MFGQLGIPEIFVIAFVGLVVLGPERLPHYAKEAGRMLRNLRNMANAATEDLKAELGPEMANLDVRDLHPKTMLRKFMEEDDTPGSSSVPAPAPVDDHSHLSWTNPAAVDNSELPHQVSGEPSPTSGFDDVT